MKIILTAFSFLFFAQIGAAQVITNFEPTLELELENNSFSIPQEYLPAKIVVGNVTHFIFESDEKIPYDQSIDLVIKVFPAKEKNGLLITDQLPIFTKICEEGLTSLNQK